MVSRRLMPLVLMPLVLFSLLSNASTTFHLVNRCPFKIWPATASNQGHPVLARGGFLLRPRKTFSFRAPGNWSGRFWARTRCQFGSLSNDGPACLTGDCGGRIQCEGLIGTPPATLVEFNLQSDKKMPDFYDVSVVDGYNLPVHVSAKGSDPKCTIPSCTHDLRDTCPGDLAVYTGTGEVVACRSACLAFGLDVYCCINKYGSADKCGPTLYSKVFKDACPSYFSYAFDQQALTASCGSEEYVLTFCPGNWGSDGSSAGSGWDKFI